MNNQRISIAQSHAFRRKGWLERCAASGLGQWLSASLFGNAGRGIYRGLLWLRTGGKGLLCTLPEGEQVRVLPEYRYVTWHEGEYRAFRAALGRGQIALDVGANVGCYSILFGQWAGHTGRVFAFEPDPVSLQGLKRHIELNGLSDCVVPEPLAVSFTSGHATFAAEGASGMHRLASTSNKSAGYEVATTTLDAFCAEQKISPTLIKIDVEGSELDVLRGARETLRRCLDVKVFVEMHPSIWPQMGLTKRDIEGELLQQGFRVEPLAPCADPWTLEGVCLRLVREQ